MVQRLISLHYELSTVTHKHVNIEFHIVYLLHYNGLVFNDWCSYRSRSGSKEPYCGLTVTSVTLSRKTYGLSRSRSQDVYPYVGFCVLSRGPRGSQ